MIVSLVIRRVLDLRVLALNRTLPLARVSSCRWTMDERRRFSTETGGWSMHLQQKLESFVRIVPAALPHHDLHVSCLV